MMISPRNGRRSKGVFCPGLKGILGVCLCSILGCGGTQLTPEEQTEYEQMGHQLQTLEDDFKGIKKEGQKQYTRLGRLERNVGIKTSDSIACSVDLNGQSFGPLPFRYKANFRVAIKDQNKISLKGRRCLRTGLKVTR